MKSTYPDCAGMRERAPGSQAFDEDSKGPLRIRWQREGSGFLSPTYQCC
jgi:hypothetical protein